VTAVAEHKVKKPKNKSFDENLPLVDDLDPVEVTQAPPNPPKPGESGFDWQAEYPGEEVFVFTAEDGTTVGLAAMGEKRRPKPGVLRKLRHQPAIEQMWFVIERVSSENALAVSDEFDDKDYSQMFEKWSEWSNTTAGESSRSSTS
jgi:hypothetical protein